MIEHPRSFAPRLLMIASLALTACAGRPADLSLDTGETGEAPDPGEPLSACMSEDECFDDWCVHPANEAGFCTFACTSADECPAASGGATATATCLLVGADEVCALDCSVGSCPSGMRCEAIEAGDGSPRSICF